MYADRFFLAFPLANKYGVIEKHFNKMKILKKIMKTIPNLVEKVVDVDSRRAKKELETGTVRVDLKHLEQMKFEAKSEGFSYIIDEPGMQGGTNSGLKALGYFTIGAASCFATHVAKAIILNNLNIDTIEILARSHFDRSNTRRFTDIVYDLKLTGNETGEKLSELLTYAENTCYVHQTLKYILPLTTRVSMNGEELLTHTVGPETGKM